jgi:hypothetical protein
MESRFYKALLGIKITWRGWYEPLINRYYIVLFEEHLTKPKDIICYGIGSVQRSKNAQYQFMLALLLRDILEVKTLFVCKPAWFLKLQNFF